MLDSNTYQGEFTGGKKKPALGSAYMQSLPPLCLYLAGSEVTLFF